MGSPSTEQDRVTDEGPQTVVTLTRGLWMGRYEVTQGEYLAVMGDNPSTFTTDLNLPVDHVSWEDATNYCATLTRRERSAGRLPAGWAYRLPTEAEWEYAARAGTTTRSSFGDDPSYSQLGNSAWFWSNSVSQTRPVGQMQANPWGLYDAHGNVWEWWVDWYGAYAGGAVTDPMGANTGSYRVFRDGSWNGDGQLCRSARRNWDGPSNRYYDLGLRVVLVLVP
jgi:formylglycine-generating enzyme required for sulfatase activity